MRWNKVFRCLRRGHIWKVSNSVRGTVVCERCAWRKKMR